MAKAILKESKKKNPYLQNTSVENLFIYEFLPTAQGEYVKVYLFGLMYAQNGLEMDIAKLSRIMSIDEEDILAAWGYWAKKGLLRVSHNNDNTEYEIEYVSLKDTLYNKEQREEVVIIPEEDNEDQISKVVNLEIQSIFTKYESLTGRMLPSEDARKIGETVKTYNILPDIMSYAVEYCVSEERASVNQIIRTAVNWVKEGCQNLVDVKNYIDKHSQRNSYYNLIFKEMGFRRLPNPPDREMMDRWFDELGYSIKDVLAACQKAAGLRDPSLRYVNKVLENKKLEQGGINTLKFTQPPGLGIATENRASVSKKVLKEYYEFIRDENEKELKKHQEEACKNIPELKELIELEKKVNNEMFSLTLGSVNAEHKKSMREQRRQIEKDKKYLLAQHGYGEDYLDKQYKCKTCKDTGMTDDGKVCSCTKARALEALEWNKSRN